MARRKVRRRVTPKPSAVSLERWDTLTAFIRILLWTGHVKNARPQSLIMVSDPGHGKTELMRRFVPNRQVTQWSDVTYRTVLGILAEAPSRGHTHIFLPELQKVINRRSQVAESTLTLMSQMMEDGVDSVGFGPTRRDLKGQRMGIVAATTMTSVAKKPFMIAELQLDSRAFIVDARGNDAELTEIRRRIVNNDLSALTPVVLDKIPEARVTVDIPHQFGEQVRIWVEDMDEKGLPVYGVRLLARLLHTLRGVALYHGRKKVTKDDVEYLYQFRKFWLEPVFSQIGFNNGDGNG